MLQTFVGCLPVSGTVLAPGIGPPGSPGDTIQGNVTHSEQVHPDGVRKMGSWVWKNPGALGREQQRAALGTVSHSDTKRGDT